MISFFLFIFSQFFFPPQPTTAHNAQRSHDATANKLLDSKIASRLDKNKDKNQNRKLQIQRAKFNLKKYLFKKKCSCATNTTSIVMLVFVYSQQ